MSIGMSPFRALYSYDPLSFMEISFGDSRALMVQDWIQQSQDILRELKDHLQRAQNHKRSKQITIELIVPLKLVI